MANHDCPFCGRLQLLSVETDDEFVFQFAHSVVLLGQWQSYRGYCIVVSRRHATELFKLEETERRGFLDEMCRTAEAIDATFKPHKLNYELLGNQVPHLHWHLFPRYLDDPDHLKPVWLTLERAAQSPAETKRLQTGPQARQHTILALREALSRR
jgi:diadenosine tetraphosphate (Ap4A) HIT family hydrolase